jgi:hypothetical protein
VKNGNIEENSKEDAMRKHISAKILMSLVLMFIFLLCSATPVFTGKGPKIRFDRDKMDFGKVKQGKILTHVFKFVNEGDETLTIDRVRTSCGCTAVLVSRKEIPPGKEGELKVTFNTRGYAGKLSKLIYVDTNDPAQKSKQITVSAEIEVAPQPKIALDSYTQDLGLFLEDEEIRTQTKIKNIGELELQVSCSHKDASFSAGGKEVSFPLKIRAGKEAEIEIRIPPRNRKGLIREYILMKSNDPQRPTLSFYLSGYIISKQQLKELFARYKDILN